MKYLKYFEESSAYETYKNGSGYVLPNVSYVEESKGISFDPYVPPPPHIEVGDVAYWDGSKVRTCAYDSYNESMGTAVGVVVIPGDFLPDGKARMAALNQSNTQME